MAHLHLVQPPKVSGCSSRTEARLLSEVMQDAETLDYLVSKGITPDHFGVPRHRRIWLLFLKRNAQGLPMHCEAILDAYYRDQAEGGPGDAAWKQYGGIHYLTDLAIPPPSAMMRDQDIAELSSALMRREVGATLLSQSDRLGTLDTNDVRERVIGELMNLKSQSPNRALSREEITALVVDDLEAELDGDRLARLQTGIEEIDQELLGVSTDGMTLVLAMSGHGKSSVLYRIALGLASSGHRVYLHGTERSAKQIRRVMAHGYSGHGPESMERIRQHQHETGNRERLERMTDDMQAAARAVGELPIEITGQGWSAERVCAYAKLLRGTGRCDVLIIDYLQDLSPSPGVAKEGMPQTAHKSRTIKDLAAELGIPALVAAQVSGEKTQPQQQTGRKAPQEPYNPRPRVHACQWSSQVHQDAEEVWGLFNADAYRKHNASVSIVGDSACIELEALKRRQGGHRKLRLSFHGPTRWVAGPLGVT
jgi:replicative DNA helicase